VDTSVKILINNLTQKAVCESTKLKKTAYILKQPKHIVKGNEIPEITHT
jgi:ribosomal protein L13E